MFEPHNDGHAISEAVFSVEFKPLPSNVLQKMLDNYPALSSLLPSKQEISGMRFEQSGSGFSFEQVPGAEWKKFGPDGKHDWIVRITPNSVSVHCLNYDRWNEVWGRSKFLLGTLFAALDDYRADVLSVGLRYIDQFEFRGNIENYNPQDLFVENCAYVPKSILTKGTRWHAYSGWFEDDAQLEYEVLHQLNIDAVEMLPGSSPVITINHAALIQSGPAGRLEKFAHLSQITDGPLDSFMNKAHDRNKEIVRDILSQEMMVRIGL